MALKNVKAKYKALIPRDNSFYSKYYAYFFWGMMFIIFLLIGMIGFVLYQAYHRPLPVFSAIQPSGEKMSLTAFEEPNLLPDTIIRWANKATTNAYTFDFVRYNSQLAAARPYFTSAGWQDYLVSVDPLIKTIVQAQLFVNGVVNGTPVISNQGSLPGQGYTWRVQIPFLVTYQTANAPTQVKFIVVLTIVRVPTNINPQGIGIDQFVMIRV